MENLTAQTSLEHFFSYPLLRWIDGCSTVYLSSELYEPWFGLHFNGTLLRKEPAARFALVKPVLNGFRKLINDVLYKKVQSLDQPTPAKNALTLFHRNQDVPVVLRKFTIDDELRRRIDTWGSLGEDFLYQLAAAQCHTVDPTIPQEECLERVFLWNNLVTLEKIRELWFGHRTRNAIHQFIGFAAVVETCLMPPAFSRSPVHSTCILIGDYIVGLRSPCIDKEGRLLVILKEKLEMARIKEIVTTLKLNLLAYFVNKTFGGIPIKIYKTEVHCNLAQCEAEVYFTAPDESHTLRLYFTWWKLLSLELVSLLGSGMTFDPTSVAGMRNMFQLIRENFLIKEFAPDPDLRLGTLITLSVWRSYSSLQEVFSQWDIIVILHTLAKRRRFENPSMVLQCFLSLAHIVCHASTADDQYFFDVIDHPTVRTMQFSQVVTEGGIDIMQLDPIRTVGSMAVDHNKESKNSAGETTAVLLQQIFSLNIQEVLNLGEEVPVERLREQLTEAFLERPEEVKPITVVPETAVNNVATQPVVLSPTDPVTPDSRSAESGVSVPSVNRSDYVNEAVEGKLASYEEMSNERETVHPTEKQSKEIEEMNKRDGKKHRQPDTKSEHSRSTDRKHHKQTERNERRSSSSVCELQSNTSPITDDEDTGALMDLIDLVREQQEQLLKEKRSKYPTKEPPVRPDSHRYRSSKQRDEVHRHRVPTPLEDNQRKREEYRRREDHRKREDSRDRHKRKRSASPRENSNPSSRRSKDSRERERNGFRDRTSREPEQMYDGSRKNESDKKSRSESYRSRRLDNDNRDRR